MMQCLQDSMHNILMWVTIYDLFTSNLGIDDNWNRLEYTWIFIVPLLFFLYVESLLSNPKFSLFSYTDCIHIVIQQTQAAESEVLHKTLPSWPLTYCRNLDQQKYCENRVFFRLVYRIQRLIFIHYQQQTQFEPM